MMEEAKLPSGETWTYPDVSIIKLGPHSFRKVTIPPPTPVPVAANVVSEVAEPVSPTKASAGDNKGKKGGKKGNKKDKRAQSPAIDEAKVVIDPRAAKKKQALKIAKRYADDEDDVHEEDAVFREAVLDELEELE
jgi:hypothetical protein